MDAMRGIDPTSSKFHTQAARNISQVGFGSIRTQKELQQDDEPETRVRHHDHVHLSHHSSLSNVNTKEETDNAAMSGELAELQEDLTEDQGDISERQERERDREMEKLGGGSRANGLRTSQEVRRLSQMDDVSVGVHEVLRDIPPQSLEPAKNIVSAQIQGSRPSEALTQLKPVERIDVDDLETAPTMGILDIHDTRNEPMAVDPGEGISAEQQQAVASQQLDQMVANLPADRKAVVDELRTAVYSWAASEGKDPGSAFAEQLHGLAKGWDDESLQVASRSFAEASREVSASAAAE